MKFFCARACFTIWHFFMYYYALDTQFGVLFLQPELFLKTNLDFIFSHLLKDHRFLIF